MSLVCGVGTNTRKSVRHCLYYQAWNSMLSRCYGNSKNPSMDRYLECSVSDDWLFFDNFRDWMVQQRWEGRVLDKDLLVFNNKIYSSSTCVFVPRFVNQFVVMSDKSRGDFPVGVSFRKDREKYRSYITKGNKYISLGHFTNPKDAHLAWQLAKIEQAREYIDIFKEDPLIISGLERVVKKIQEDVDSDAETKNI